MSDTLTCQKTEMLLPCPLCGEPKACLLLDLVELSEPESDCLFKCRECEGEFGRPMLRDMIRKWTKVLTWLDAAPNTADED